MAAWVKKLKIKHGWHGGCSPQRMTDNAWRRYDTIRYDTVYLTCSKKLTCSQLSPPQGRSSKIKEKTN